MMKPDPITTEIIRNAFIACAQDMNATLIRSAYTPIIYEGVDCAVAILDENADVLGQSVGVPLFLGNLEACVKLTADLLGRQAFRPGDIFHMNDSYMTGTHLNDATIFAPIFWQDRLVGFAATRAHWLDVGAKDPGGPMDSHEIYQEGVRWGPTRLYDRGEPREDIIDLLRRNGRFGYSLVGDMNAQVAACRTGERRFREILDRFGYEAYTASRLEIYRQSEELERAAVAAIPDGRYTAEGSLDDDGLGTGPLPVRVQIDVRGDQMTIDLAGSSPQTRGPVNCGFAQAVSGCRLAFKLLINPERPVDGGTFRTLAVKAPPRSMFSAEEPAACQWYFTPCGLLIDLVVKALSPALPAEAAAGPLRRLDGRLSGRLRPAVQRGALPHGGAAPGRVGRLRGRRRRGRTDQQRQRGLQGSAHRDLRVQVSGDDHRLWIPHGRAGRIRGGCGIYRTTRMEAPAYLYLWFERSVTPAWGLFGGGTAVGPDVVVNPGRADERHMLKVNGLALKPGDVVDLLTGGGGGFGNPLERDPERVRVDVLDGYVSRERAERVYGIVLDEALRVDKDATARVRKKGPTL